MMADERTPVTSEKKRALIPNFEGQVMAVEGVEQLLRRVSKALDDAGIIYAVVGGNAVAAWVATVDEGAVRATKDVDILIRREDLAAATAACGPVGLVPTEVLGVTMFLDQEQPNPKTGVHIVFANERIRPHYAHPAPDPEAATRTPGGILVLDLLGLVKMKLLAYRDIDRVHLRDLLSMELIDEVIIGELPADLRERLQEIQDTPEG